MAKVRTTENYDALVVAGYHMEAGVWLPDGDANPNPMKVMGFRRKVGYIRQIMNAAVPSGVERLTIMPSVGFLGRVKSIGAWAPAIPAAAGNHEWIVALTTSTSPTSDRLYTISVAANLDLLASPTAAGATAAKDVVFDATYPLVITYNNPSGTSQTSARTITVSWEEEAVTA